MFEILQIILQEFSRSLNTFLSVLNDGVSKSENSSHGIQTHSFWTGLRNLILLMIMMEQEGMIPIDHFRKNI